MKGIHQEWRRCTVGLQAMRCLPIVTNLTHTSSAHKFKLTPWLLFWRLIYNSKLWQLVPLLLIRYPVFPPVRGGQLLCSQPCIFRCLLREVRIISMLFGCQQSVIEGLCWGCFASHWTMAWCEMKVVPWRIVELVRLCSCGAVLGKEEKEIFD